MNPRKNTENKMGIMPVKPLVITLAVPMMLSMLVQAVYNMVDSFFVARISDAALTGVTLAFPAQLFITSVSTGLCIGVNAILSEALGKKDFAKSDSTAYSGIKLALFSSIIVLLTGIFLTKIIIFSQCKDDVSGQYGIGYLEIVLTLSIFSFLEMMFERLLQATGKSNLSMIAMFSGAILNIILDPLFIFGIGPFPRLETKGAAIATVTGQAVAFIIALILNITKNKEINFRLSKILNPAIEYAKEILWVAIPATLSIGLGTVVAYGINFILGHFTSQAQNAIAVYGIYIKVKNFFFMPVFGLSAAVIPIIAYNSGAKRPDRIKETKDFSMVLTAAIMVAGSLAFTLFPENIIKIFSSTDDMIKLGKPAMRIFGTSFLFGGLSVIITSFLQAIQKSTWALVINIVRTAAILISAWLLSRTGEIADVWWCLLISETAAVAVCMVYSVKVKSTFN